MNSKLLIILVAVALLVGLFFIFSGQSPTVPEMADPTETADTTDSQLTDDEQETPGVIFVNLNEQNNSGETGSATLTEENGQVTVALSMQGYLEDTPQPAHIHVGSCPDVGAVQYPLMNLVNGESTTVLEVTLAQLAGELPLGINVHKSVPEASVYTACGDIIL
jgi:hypothetical protein